MKINVCSLMQSKKSVFHKLEYIYLGSTKQEKKKYIYIS